MVPLLSPSDNGREIAITLAHKESSKYREAIKRHARRSKEEYLHAGVHYQAFASFLSPNHLSLVDQDQTRFDHIVVKRIGTSRIETESFDRLIHPDQLQLLTGGGSHKANIVFIRGFCRPSLLNCVAAQSKISPEFFRRHLNFLQRRNLYDLPALPSSSREILRVRITTICTRQTPITRGQIAVARKQQEQHIQTHHGYLATHGQTGDSIIRTVDTHNEVIFTLGQDITCTVRRTVNGWTGLAWQDTGRDLYERPPGKWFDEQPNGLSTCHSCHPVVLHNHRFSKPEIASESVASTFPKTRTLGQSASVLPAQYACELDPSVMILDASYGLSGIVNFAAASEQQFLNMVSEQIDRDLRYIHDDIEGALEGINYSKLCLDEHLRISKETLRCLRSNGATRWPRARDLADKEVSDAVTSAEDSMLLDYESLVEQTEALIRQCVQTTSLIVNRASLEESRKAAEQNSRISRLTRLAFFFVPMTFVGTFFGMNFSVFGQGELSIWIGVVSLLIVCFASFCLYFAEKLATVVRCVRRIGRSSAM